MNPEQITITPTPEVGVLNGVPCRVWDGTTGDGRACKVWVALVGIRDDQEPAELEARLIPMRPRLVPDPEVN